MKLTKLLNEQTGLCLFGACKQDVDIIMTYFIYWQNEFFESYSY